VGAEYCTINAPIDKNQSVGLTKINESARRKPLLWLYIKQSFNTGDFREFESILVGCSFLLPVGKMNGYKGGKTQKLLESGF
jgi:hypothetical protein